MDDWQQNIPHRRYNLLTQSWILCSPHRAKRPWLGQVEKATPKGLNTYDPTCFLCPGNKRSGEAPVNPPYTGTFVFTNDFSALLPPEESQNQPDDDLLVSEQVSGNCKVICFSPKHDVTLADMEVKEIIPVVETWKKEYESIGSDPNINYVQIFENKGAVMGCSNPHPHCQSNVFHRSHLTCAVWASSFIPEEPQVELDSMKSYFEKKGTCLLCDYVKLELVKQIRIVCENENFVALVPYWALWPYELLILSKKHIENLTQFDPHLDADFADIIKRVALKYDNLFQTSFPYSSGIHQSPTDGKDHKNEVHFHMHFYPPLLRSATVKKFMVGFEMLGEPQRDITAEQSAAKLRSLSDTVHYRDAKDESGL